VRSKPGRGELRIQQALAAFVSALAGSKIPWMVIGGIAIIARGVRRMTTDIDAVVRGDRVDVPTLLRLLAKKRIIPRIDDAAAFVRESMVLLLRHDPTGVEFDVSFAWTAFEHDAIEVCSSRGAAARPAPPSDARKCHPACIPVQLLRRNKQATDHLCVCGGPRRHIRCRRAGQEVSMKKKTLSKKLTLVTETLSLIQLDQVLGGATLWACSPSNVSGCQSKPVNTTCDSSC
jgi:hypothetical protein